MSSILNKVKRFRRFSPSKSTLILCVISVIVLCVLYSKKKTSKSVEERKELSKTFTESTDLERSQKVGAEFDPKTFSIPGWPEQRSRNTLDYIDYEEDDTIIKPK